MILFQWISVVSLNGALIVILSLASTDLVGSKPQSSGTKKLVRTRQSTLNFVYSNIIPIRCAYFESFLPNNPFSKYCLRVSYLLVVSFGKLPGFNKPKGTTFFPFQATQSHGGTVLGVVPQQDDFFLRRCLLDIG